MAVVPPGTIAASPFRRIVDTDGNELIMTPSGEVPVLGPLTDTELRASEVPISMANRDVLLYDSAGTPVVLESGRLPVANIVVDSADPTRAQEFDTLFRVPYTMDVAHHEVHERDAYEASYYDEDAASGHVVQFMFTTPAAVVAPTKQKRMHMTFEHEGSGEHQFRILENVTYAAGGSAFVPPNKFREAVPHTTAATSFLRGSDKDGDVITYTGGSVFKDSWGGSGRSQGGSGRGNTEWVLWPGVTYIFEIFSRAVGTVIELTLDWYEHTDSE